MICKIQYRVQRHRALEENGRDRRSYDSNCNHYSCQISVLVVARCTRSSLCEKKNSSDLQQFVGLFVFFWPLWCLSFFDTRNLIAPSVSLNSYFVRKLRFHTSINKTALSVLNVININTFRFLIIRFLGMTDCYYNWKPLPYTCRQSLIPFRYTCFLTTRSDVQIGIHNPTSTNWNSNFYQQTLEF